MPYKKTYKKRNGYKRPGYRRCGKMVIGDAQKALAMAKYLKNIVNVEFKHITNEQTALTMAITAGTIVQLTNLSQGDTTLTRDGSQIKAVSIQIDYFIKGHVDELGTAARLMLVHDKQTNQAAYASSDLLHDVTINDVVVSPRNLDNTQRFSVLYDKTHIMGNNGSNISRGSFYKPLQIKLRYDGNDGTIADLTQSSLSLFVCSSVVANPPIMTASIRIRFVDN